jgi:hypothetical protein
MPTPPRLPPDDPSRQNLILPPDRNAATALAKPAPPHADNPSLNGAMPNRRILARQNCTLGPAALGAGTVLPTTSTA